MTREDNISSKIDWVTVALYMAIVLIGWLNIYAVTYDQAAGKSIFDIHSNSGRQLFFIGGSMIIIMIILIIDMRFYETFGYVIYGAILFIVLLVPVIGREVGGNKAWLAIGPFSLQPSEFAKFATALAVAKFIGSVGFKMDNLRNQAILFMLIGAPMAFILLQKDTGTAMVFTVFTLVYFREGMSPFLIIMGIAGAVIFILTLVVNQYYLFIGVGVILVAAILLGKRN